MRFKSLKIENFKAVRLFEVNDLTNFILIAGPNGCGKSCVLDAIRLLKSVHGGYQANEWMQWFGEFQIDLNDRDQVRRLFRDQTQPINMAATIELDQSEKNYLLSNAEEVVAPMVWAAITGQPLDSSNFATVAIAPQYRHHEQQAAQNISAAASLLKEALAVDSFPLALTINPDLQLNPQSNPAIGIIFQTYLPNYLGVIEYHSASRSYQREAIGAVNLDAKQFESQRVAQSLYNWQQKYLNVKTQLATTYIRGLIARESGVSNDEPDPNETLKELFQTFFPDKEYLGVEPDPNGGLRFPVRTRGGQVHDINELSSGEKEVLYGYLRLRNSTPRNSTLLLDEPELHLNPGLLRGFPDFYAKNLGKARNNQLWLVTHSDTLLRQAVGNPNYSVFHMTAADTDGTTDLQNQAVIVLAQDELERATIDLVGDLATYRPQGKVVLFEGGGDTDTDVRMTEKLFPNFAKSVNLVSGGSKQRVRDLYEVLSDTAEKVGMADRFFAITDKDSTPWETPPAGAHQLSWDVYHIENYLLEPSFVGQAVEMLLGQPGFASDEQVLDALHDAAEEILPSLVLARLKKIVNDKIVGSVHLGGNSKGRDVAEALIESVTATFSRLNAAQGELDKAFLETQAVEIKAQLSEALNDGTWVKEFPGRSVLQRFAGSVLAGSGSYEGFRNVIVDQMVDAGFEPAGMRHVIDLITATNKLVQPPV
jgi:predicted ATPase